jgi:hypothetical protein
MKKIGKLKKKERKRKKEKVKKKEENTMNYCCNPQCFVCKRTVISPHHLEYVVISINYGKISY